MTDQAEDFTNDPHPALETPLLYFLLRPFPRLRSWILVFYEMRWDTSDPLQNRIPCSRNLQKIGIIVTWSDLFLAVPFVVLMVEAVINSAVYPSVSVSGHIARLPLIFTYVTATKNNVLTFFLGLPVERAVKYHKVSARVAYFNSVLHAYAAITPPLTTVGSGSLQNVLFQDRMNASGTVLVLIMTVMIITALPYVRRKVFELFYFIHVVCAALLMACAFYHSGFLVPLLTGLTWGLDFIVRKLYMPFFRYPRQGTTRIISDSVVELSFPKKDGFDFNPTQYIYLAVPELGYFQWHPFSMSSSPKQKVVTLHIRKTGYWTNALYALAQRQSDIGILLEGPYGSIGVDFTNPYKYQTVMLFSGGIGVTPMQSLCNSLLHEHNKGIRKLKKLSFIWIERDPVVMSEVDVVRRESTRYVDSTDVAQGCTDEEPHNITRDSAMHSLFGITPNPDAEGATNFAAQLLGMVPEIRLTDAQIDESYPIDLDDTVPYATEDTETTDVEDVLQQSGHFPRCTFATVNEGEKWSGADGSGASRRPPSRSLSFNMEVPHPSWCAGQERSVNQSFLDHAFPTSNDSPVDLQVYLTDMDVSVATKEHMSQMPFIHFGRPDIKDLFRQARHEALRSHQQSHIAVCVCAPRRIVHLCRKACAKFSDGRVSFDFHSEVFE
jgi:predicted ferric reductase